MDAALILKISSELFAHVREAVTRLVADLPGTGKLD